METNKLREKILLDFRFQNNGMIKRYSIKKQQKIKSAMTIWCKDMGIRHENVDFFWKKQKLNGSEVAEVYENQTITVVLTKVEADSSIPRIDGGEMERKPTSNRQYRTNGEANEGLLGNPNECDDQDLNTESTEAEPMEMDSDEVNLSGESVPDKLSRLKPRVELFLSYLRGPQFGKCYELARQNQNNCANQYGKCLEIKHANELNALKTKLDEQLVHLKAIQGEKESMQKQIDEMETEGHKLKSQMETEMKAMETKCEALQAQFESEKLHQSSEMKVLQDQKEELENQVLSMKSAMDKQMTDLNNIQGENISLKDSVNTMQTQLDQKSSAFLILQDKHDNLTERLKFMENKHTNEMNDLEEKNKKEMDEKIDELQKHFDEEVKRLTNTNRTRNCVNCNNKARFQQTLPYCKHQCIEDHLKNKYGQK